jgi:hypothetical protein
MLRNRLFALLGLLVLASMVISACGSPPPETVVVQITTTPGPTQTPNVIVETQIVTVPVEVEIEKPMPPIVVVSKAPVLTWNDVSPRVVYPSTEPVVPNDGTWDSASIVNLVGSDTHKSFGFQFKNGQGGADWRILATCIEIEGTCIPRFWLFNFTGEGFIQSYKTNHIVIEAGDDDFHGNRVKTIYVELFIDHVNRIVYFKEIEQPYWWSNPFKLSPTGVPILVTRVFTVTPTSQPTETPTNSPTPLPTPVDEG